LHDHGYTFGYALTFATGNQGTEKGLSLYCRMPKEYWPEIAIAEKDDAEGLQIFNELREIYMKKHFN
jgi:hypothetical protein